MIRLEAIYVLMGLLTGGIALVNARDDSNPRRWRNTLFWGVYALLFFAGSYFSDLANGLLVLVMVATAAAGLGQGTRESVTAANRAASALRHRNRLFVPVLVVPLATFWAPPPTAALLPLAAFMFPPAIAAWVPLAAFRSPPPMAVCGPVAAFEKPPPTVA
jgi:uncharacterized membrane protein